MSENVERVARVARVARAICNEYGDVYDEQPADLPTLREWRKREGSVDANGVGIVRAYDPGLPTQKDWQDMARAAIEEHTAALAEAGFAIVPREPTEAMVSAGAACFPYGNRNAATTPWRAMIDAARGAIECNSCGYDAMGDVP